MLPNVNQMQSNGYHKNHSVSEPYKSVPMKYTLVCFFIKIKSIWVVKALAGHGKAHSNLNWMG